MLLRGLLNRMRRTTSLALSLALATTGVAALDSALTSTPAYAANCGVLPTVYGSMPAMADAKWQPVRTASGSTLSDPSADISGNSSNLDLYAAANDSVLDWYANGTYTMFRMQLFGSAVAASGQNCGIANGIYLAALGKMVNGAPSTLAWVGVNGGGANGPVKAFVYNPKTATTVWSDTFSDYSGSLTSSAFATTSGSKNYIAFQVPTANLTSLGASSGVGFFVGTSNSNSYSTINKDYINTLGSTTTPTYSSVQTVNTSANLATVAAPTITSFTPTGGAVAGGTQVTVTGTNLDNLATVKFGTATAQIVSSTSTTVTVLSPASPIASPSTGPVKISVTNVAGTATSIGDFTYSANLTATTLALTAPGTLVTGQIKTLSATVKDSAATSTLTAASGAILFKNQSGTTLCTATISNGTASCSYMPITVTPVTISATYGGDATYAGSNASATSITPSKGATKVIFSAPSAPADNQAIAITASVFNSTGQNLLESVTGSVIYSSPSSANLCTATDTTLTAVAATSSSSPGVGILASGKADCSWWHAAGSLTITATYSGDTNFLSASTSSSTGAAQLATPVISGTSATGSTISVTFGAVSNRISYIARVYDSAGIVVQTSVVGTSTTLTADSGLAPLTTYKVTVQALGDGINYTDSAESTLTTQQTAVQSLPTPNPSLTGSATATSATIGFSSNANATAMTASISPSSGITVPSVSNTDTSTTITGLEPGTQYTYSLTAIGNGSSYSDSLVGSITFTTTALKLSTPALTYVSRTSSSITFNISTTSANASSYKLSVFDSSGAAITALDVAGISSSATTATAVGLSPGVTYTFKLTAIGDVTHYTNSDATVLTAGQATSKAQLAKPTLTVAPGSNAHEFILTASKIANASSYKFTLFEAGGSSVDAIEVWDGSSSTISHTFTNVTENTVITATVEPIPSDSNAYLADATNSVNHLVDSLRTFSPAFGSVTRTSDGYRIPFTNYSSSYDFTFTADHGSVTLSLISGVNYLVVTGLDSGSSAVISMSWHRAGFSNGSQNLSSQSALNSSQKQLLAFALNVNGSSVTGTVNESNKTAAVTVPYGTSLSALVSTFSVSSHADLSVGQSTVTSGFTENFSAPVTITVTAQDGTTQDYVVTVTQAAQGAQNLAAPTWTAGSVSSTSSTIDLVFTGVSGATSYTIKVYDGSTLLRSITGISSSATTQQVSNLSPNKTYSFVIIAEGNGTSLLTSADSTTLNKATTKLNIASPSFTFAPGSTHDAVVVVITPVAGASNYRIVIVEANGTTTTVDVVASSSAAFSTTILGIHSNKRLDISVIPTADDPTNSDTTNASANLNPTLLTFTPVLAAPVSTVDGFTVEIANFAAQYDWLLSTDAGQVALTHVGSQWFATVTGLSAGASATITVTSSRAGYADASPTASGAADAATQNNTTNNSNSNNNNSNNNNSNNNSNSNSSNGNSGSGSTETPAPPKETGPKVNLDPKTPAAVIPLPENSGLKAGQNKVEEGGKAVEVRIAPNNSKTAVEIQAPDWTLEIKPTNPVSSNVAPVGNTGGLNIVLGSKVDVAGTKFAPNTVVKIYIFSEPTLLGEFQTDANGDFAVQVSVPSSLALGEHTLQVNGLGVNNNLRSASVPVVAKSAVTKSKNLVLIFTGNSSELTKQAKSQLAAFAKAVKSLAAVLSVKSSGFAKREAASTKAFALQLSKDRATTVIASLKAAGVKGKFALVANGYATQNNSFARRVEVSATWKVYE